ncbi:MAG: hypothetical protein QGG64_04035 [Candidatus Latescibacteria bacterium]|nr:hypothetical protein [Candidatus Latescibacterota bacterium]
MGDINDFSVQQVELATYLTEVLPRSRKADQLLSSAAVGGLITCLHDRQQVSRRAFNETFCAFAAKPDLYRDLFGKKKEAM